MTAVEQLGENRERLTVDVSPDQVRHAVDHAMADLSESVKIPGFRKGKIPKQVLISRLGKDRIYAEAVDSHIRGWFQSAASRSRIRPVTNPEYDFELPSTADAAWSFAATVEVQPLPELVDGGHPEGCVDLGVDLRPERLLDAQPQLVQRVEFAGGACELVVECREYLLLHFSNRDLHRPGSTVG